MTIDCSSFISIAVIKYYDKRPWGENGSVVEKSKQEIQMDSHIIFSHEQRMNIYMFICWLVLSLTSLCLYSSGLSA